MEQRRIRKVKRLDKAARWFITAGGMLIIVSVAGIFFLIAGVAAPLFFPPDITHRTALPTGESPGRVLAVGSDEYLETAYLLNAGGEFVFRSWRDGRVLDTVRLAPPGKPHPSEGRGPLSSGKGPLPIGKKQVSKNSCAPRSASYANTA